MNILILNWKDIKHPEVGGAEIIAFYLARKLAADGHKVTFFCSTFPQAKKEEQIDNVKIVRRGSKLGMFWQAYKYYKSLKSKPDKVIEMINTIGWQTPLYVPKDKRIAYLNQLAQEVWFYEFPLPLALFGYLLEKLQYITYKRTKLICYSKSTKDDLISYGIPQKNILLFSLGLDHKRYKLYGKKSKNPLFIFVARLVKMKRPDLCIKAFAKILKKYPKAQLAIIGSGPYEDELIEMAKKLKLEKSVSFVNKDSFYIDYKKGDIKVRLMQEAWALLLPSVKEGWGMVITEAAACGTPSIVTDVSGLRDSVKRNKTGIIISGKPTEKELSSAMLKIIENKKLRKEFYSNSVELSKKFNWSKTFTEFKKIVLNG